MNQQIHCTEKEVTRILERSDVVLSEDLAPWEEEEQIQQTINIAHGAYRLAKDWRTLNDWLIDSLAIQLLLRTEFWVYEDQSDPSWSIEEHGGAIDTLESAIRHIDARGGKNVEVCAEILRRRATSIDSGLELVECQECHYTFQEGNPPPCKICARETAIRFRQAAQEFDPELKPTKLCEHHLIGYLKNHPEANVTETDPKRCEFTRISSCRPEPELNENQQRLAEGKEWKDPS